jgi:phosphomannomutase
MGIFHAYDIRGFYEKEITIQTAVAVAIGYVKAFSPKKMCICYDARIGSEELANALVDTFLDLGVDVYFAGLTTTPMLYFAVNKYSCDGGIVVTASHNPKEYTGFKLCKEKALPIGKGSGLELIESFVVGSDEKSINQYMQSKLTQVSKGKLYEISLVSDYVSFLAPYLNVESLKVAFDCSNGSVCVVIKEVLENTQLDALLLNDSVDGTFPSHEPNPMKKESIEELSDVVREHECDLGIIYDGDADRLAAVDERGNRVRPDIIAILIAKLFLEQNPKDVILYDLRSSKTVAEIVHSYGATSHKTRVGHSFIKADMRKYDAVFASELSGHYYYRDFFYCDNAIITTFLLLKAISESGRKLSELVSELSFYEKIEETNFKVVDVASVLNKIKVQYRVLEELDGVTIGEENWWANIRASNTEPLIRLNLEAQTPELLTEKFTELQKVILNK